MNSETPLKCPYVAVFADLHGYQGKVKAELSPDACKQMRVREFLQCRKCEKWQK